jgi:hypothetical protein
MSSDEKKPKPPPQPPTCYAPPPPPPPPPDDATMCYSVVRVTEEDTTVKKLEDQLFQLRQQMLGRKISPEAIDKALAGIEREIADGSLEKRIDALPEGDRGTLIVRYRKLADEVREIRSSL